MLKEPWLINDKYDVIRQLGKGGMGSVYLAENKNLKTLWAIKEVALYGDSDILAEPEILKKLNFHALPRIVQIEIGKEYMYIIEDYIEGLPLDQELKRRGRFPEKDVRDFAEQLCDILNYLHKFKGGPIIYRDMKPSNLIVSPDNKLKLVDFGIARVFKKDSQSDTTYIGTRGYAAPEQYGGKSQTDERTDIYSLGVTLYHLLTGKSPNEPPYELKPLREIDPRFSYGMEHIIAKCTRLDPKERYQTVEAILKDLRNIDKFDKSYKRAVFARNLRILLSFAMLLASLTVTYLGWNRIGQEKIEAYESLVSEGRNYVEDKNYESAEAAFDKAITSFPSRVDAYREYALMLLDADRYEDTIEFIQEGLDDINAQTEDYAELNYIIGTAYFEKAREANEDREIYAKAAGYFKKALQGVSYSVDYRRDMAASLACSGDVDSAEIELEKLNSDAKAEESVFYVKGQIKNIKEQYAEAAKDFEKCIGLTSDEDLKNNAYISCGRAYQKAGMYSEAVKILEEARKSGTNSETPTILFPLAYSYYSMGNETNDKDSMNKALEIFDLVIQKNYSKGKAFESEVNILRSMHRYDDAGKKALEWSRQYPDEYKCFAQLSFIEIESELLKKNGRDFSKAYEYYKSAKKLLGSGSDKALFDSLENTINELIEKNWIEGE